MEAMKKQMEEEIRAQLMANQEAMSDMDWDSKVSAPSRLIPVLIIQILTGTVMKYHVSVDSQESYIFPREYCPEGKYKYLGTTDMWYFIRPGRYLLY